VENIRFAKWLIGISVLPVAVFICVFVVLPVNMAGDEQAPFAAGETINERQTLTKPVLLEYVVIEAKYLNRYWFAGSDIWVTVRNIDTQDGSFTVNFELIAADGTTSTLTASQYIAAGEAEKFMVYHDHGHVVYLEYTILPPTKEVKG